MDGYCYLKGRSDHTGIKVKFIRVSPSAVTCSTYTGATGYYSQLVAPGIYHVEYSHAGFTTYTVPDKALLTSQSLDRLWIFPANMPQLSGNLSGVLGPGGYFIAGETIVPTNQTLTIRPGTRLFFAGPYDFCLNGALMAVGTASDSIVFTRAYPTDASRGRRFYFNYGSYHRMSRMEYVVIEHLVGGIGSDQSALQFYDSLLITDCSFRLNVSNLPIVAGGYEVVFNRCVIRDNTSAWLGIVFSCRGDVKIHNTTIVRNRTSPGQPGACALQIDYPGAIVSQCIIASNEGYGIRFEISAQNSRVEFTDFYDNSLGNFSGDGPPYLGQLLVTNANGDSADIWSNIFEDLMFEDTARRNYHLRYGSPCIDAGDPYGPPDPDGTVADLGAYFFEQSLRALPSAVDFGDVEISSQGFRTCVLRNYGSQPVSIYGVATTNPVFTHDYDPSDTLIVPSDSIVLNLVFSPVANGAQTGELLVFTSATYLDTMVIPLYGEGGLIPAPVHDLVIQSQYPDAQLCWTAVDTTIHGNPVEVDAYLIYYSESSGGPFFFHGYSPDTCYIHSGVVQFAPAMSYEVAAYVGSIGLVAAIPEGTRREEVERALSTAR